MIAGQVVEVRLEAQQSALVGGHSIGATSITVADPTPFDDDGGSVRIDGATYTYTAVGVITDPLDGTSTNGVLTLSTGLLDAEPDATPVAVWSGSQVLDSLVLVVVTDFTGSDSGAASLDLGSDFTFVSVKATERAQWSALEGMVDPPIAVTLSDDLTRVLDAPGYTPSVDGAALVALPDPAAVAIDPPTISPAITSVTGNPSGLTVVTEPILPTTLLDFYINGVLVESNQRTTIINLVDDGTNPLALDTDYTVTVQAHNSATDADPLTLPAISAGVTARLDPGMTATEVTAILQAGFILAGTIQVGSSMLLDGVSGITITQTDGRQTYFRADGSGNQLVGQAILDSLIANGNVTINGLTNNLNGLMTLGTGVSDPTSKPGVTAAGWDSVNNGGSNYGISPGGLFDNGTGWVYTDSVLYSGNVNSADKTTGARGLLATMPTNFGPYGGAVKVGTSWYVLGRDGARGGNWYVYIFNSSWVKTGEWQATTDSGASLAIGVDASNLLIAKRFSTTNALEVWTYTTAGAVVGSALSCGTWAGAQVTGVVKAAVDTATVRFVVSSSSSGIRVFNTSTGARVTSEEWPTAAGPLGLAYDGTNWFTLDTAKVWKYTNLIGTYDFAFTWVDNDAGGAGTAETKRSALRSVAPTKRAKWTISLPSPPPDDGTTDGANTASLYAVATGGTLVIQTALVEGTYSVTYSTLATSGAAPPSVSGFATRMGAIGRLSSAAVDGASNPLLDFKGDGSYRLNGAPQDEVALTALTPASGFANTGTLGYQVRNGQVFVFANFTATTGNPFTSATEVTIAAAGAIPAAYRPTIGVSGGARVGGFGGACMSVLTDGSITVRNDTGAARASLRATLSYPKP